MHDTSTILGRHIVAGNDTECVAHGLNHRQQLLVLHAHEVGTFIATHYTVRQEFLTFLIFRHLATVGNLSSRIEISRHAGIGQNNCYLLSRIRIIGLKGYIVNLRAYTECGVGSQGPRRGSPSHEEGRAPTRHFGLRVLHAEECRAGGVLHVAVATWLVQLMARQASTGSGAIGLNGVALIEQTFIVELLQQIPQGLYIFVVVGDVGVVKVDEVTHLLREIAPLLGVHHHVLAAFLVILLRRDILLRLLVVDVGLGDAQRLLHAQLHRQAVCVPACLALYLEATHGLIAVERVLQCTSQYMMNARMTISRGRTLEEYELRASLTLINAAMKDVILHPFLQNLIIYLCQVKAVRLGESLCHLSFPNMILITTLSF